MSKLLLYPSSTAQWHALLQTAQQKSEVLLEEDLESYLVFLLMRFAVKPEVANSVLALDFLESMQSHRKDQTDKLRDIGDKCLLFAGLFPDRAIKRQLTNEYFIKLGQSAYSTLALNAWQDQSKLFSQMCQGFREMTNVLQATREEKELPKDVAQLLSNWFDPTVNLSSQEMEQMTKNILSIPTISNKKH